MSRTRRARFRNRGRQGILSKYRMSRELRSLVGRKLHAVGSYLSFVRANTRYEVDVKGPDEQGRLHGTITKIIQPARVPEHVKLNLVL